jgi:hypothetical protein
MPIAYLFFNFNRLNIETLNFSNGFYWPSKKYGLNAPSN